MADDIFDAALNIEDSSYNEGYTLGHNDGSQAGLLEGRAFGLQKGFEKFFEMGKLHGRACVWGARLSAGSSSASTSDSTAAGATAGTATGENVGTSSSSTTSTQATTDEHAGEAPIKKAPAITQQTPRLEKHVRTLFALTEPEQVVTVNEEAAVADVDDRIKLAVAKAKVIQRLLREQDVQLLTLSSGAVATTGTGNNAGRGGDVRLANAPLAERNIEDFVGNVARPS